MSIKTPVCCHSLRTRHQIFPTHRDHASLLLRSVGLRVCLKGNDAKWALPMNASNCIDLLCKICDGTDWHNPYLLQDSVKY